MVAFFMPAPLWIQKGAIDFLQLSSVDHGQNQSVSIGFGAEHSTRRIIVGVHWEVGSASRSLTSITIGGVTGVIHAQDAHTGGLTGLGAAICSALVPTGTSGTAAFGFNGNVQTGVLSVFRAINLASATPYATQTTRGFNDTDVSDTIDIPSNGGLIIVGTGSTNTAGEPVTITGATEVFDQDMEDAGGCTMGGALSTGLQAETGRTIRYNMGSIPDSGVEMIAASWQLK